MADKDDDWRDTRDNEFAAGTYWEAKVVNKFRVIQEEAYCDHARFLGYAYKNSDKKKKDMHSDNPGICAAMAKEKDECSSTFFYFAPCCGNCYCASSHTIMGEDKQLEDECHEEERTECSIFNYLGCHGYKIYEQDPQEIPHDPGWVVPQELDEEPDQNPGDTAGAGLAETIATAFAAAVSIAL